MILVCLTLAERIDMTLRTWLRRLGPLAVVLLITFGQTALAADKGEKLPPYDVTGLEHTKVWVPWVFAFLFAAGGMIVAFKNPHRASHERD